MTEIKRLEAEKHAIMSAVAPKAETKEEPKVAEEKPEKKQKKASK